MGEMTKWLLVLLVLVLLLGSGRLGTVALYVLGGLLALSLILDHLSVRGWPL